MLELSALARSLRLQCASCVLRSHRALRSGILSCKRTGRGDRRCSTTGSLLIGTSGQRRREL